MRSLFLISSLLFYISGFSQDGSDILYGKPEILNSSHIGKQCHIDFGKSSGPSRRQIDTIHINMNGKSVAFVERRFDNGFNNWFGAQYLEALPMKKDYSIRITSSKIDRLTNDKIYVTSYISYFKNGNPLDTITTIQHSYSKNNIAKILFNAKQF